MDKLSKLLTIKDKKELKEITSSEKLLNDYYDKMDRLSNDKEYCRMVWDERIDEKLRNIDAYNGGEMVGYEKGHKEGIKEGSLETKKEIILKLHKKNIPIDTIAECANLSVDEVQIIIETINK